MNTKASHNPHLIPLATGLALLALCLLVAAPARAATASDTGEIVLTEVSSTIQWEWEGSYTVTFDLADKSDHIGGGPLEQIVEHGGSAIVPEVSVHAGWAFVGWNKSFDNITSGMTITALYTPPGSGTAGDPYQISTHEHLEAVNDNLSSHYILMNDIDLSGGIYTRAVIAPFFEYASPRFTGTFEGNDFEVRNLRINGIGNHYVALFGRVGSGGSITNLGVVDCEILGHREVGGICGSNEGGSITSSYVTGKVSSSDYYVGGLCGINHGTINFCYAAVDVVGQSGAGGLCGSNYGTIHSSFARGSVSGPVSGGLCRWNGGAIHASFSTVDVSGSQVGGLVGRNIGTIHSSYATGAITGNNWFGGLCGLNAWQTGGGTIIASYSTGVVSPAGSYVGGLCGRNDFYSHTYGTISASFWDVETSERATSHGGEGKTTAEMLEPDTFLSVGWNFEDTWVMAPSDSPLGGYPVFQWQAVYPSRAVTLRPGEHGSILEANHGSEYAGLFFDGELLPDINVVAEDGYVFWGWQPSVPTRVTRDIEATAHYRELPFTVTVTFRKYTMELLRPLPR